MVKNTRLLIILLILIVMMLGLVIGIIKVRQANTVVMTNQADISFLKQSDFANNDFQKVEIGDSFEEVEKRMGDLTVIDIDSKYDVYEFSDESARYNFYFSDGLLVNVSMYAL